MNHNIKREDGVILPTPMRVNPIYVRVYILWMNLFVQIVIPFLVLIILNSFIYKKIKAFEIRTRDGNSARTNLKVSFTSHISSKLPQSDNIPPTSGNKSQDIRLHMLKPSVNIPRCRSLQTIPSSTKNENVTRRVETPKSVQQARLSNNQTTKNNVQQKQQDLRKDYTCTIASNSYDDTIDPYIHDKENVNEEKEIKQTCCTVPNNVGTSTVNEYKNERKSMAQECGDNRNPLITNTDSTQTMNAKGHQAVRRMVSIKLQTNRGSLESYKTSVVKTSSGGPSLRRREVALAKISLYIVFVMLICHGVRLIPNTYEMIETYTQVSLIHYTHISTHYSTKENEMNHSAI